jgi:hypothetical protein
VASLTVLRFGGGNKSSDHDVMFRECLAGRLRAAGSAAGRRLWDPGRQYSRRAGG